MYTIVVSDSNELTTTISERIIRKSNLVDNLHFLVNPLYKNSINMRHFKVRLDYILPISQDHYYVYLNLSKCLYKGMLEYRIPFDKILTSEAGDLKVWLTFTKTERDKDGNKKQLVRRTTPTTIPIFSCENNCEEALYADVATNREVDDAFDHMLHKFKCKNSEESDDEDDSDDEEIDDETLDDESLGDDSYDDEGSYDDDDSDGSNSDEDDDDSVSPTKVGNIVFTDEQEPDGTVIEI